MKRRPRNALWTLASMTMAYPAPNDASAYGFARAIELDKSDRTSQV